MAPILVRGIEKSYHRVVRRGSRQTVHALHGINLEVADGERVGIVGPNGAGKSTLVKILTGVLKPDSGDVRIFGLDPFEKRLVVAKQYGVVFGQRHSLWQHVPARESLRFLGSMYGIAARDLDHRITELSHMLEVEELLNADPFAMSLGQRTRFELVSVLLHRPSLLFLDEATVGLDVVSKAVIRRFIRANPEMAVIFCSHDLHEVEHLCTRVSVLANGAIWYDGALTELTRMYGETMVRQVTVTPRGVLDSEVAASIKRIAGVREVRDAAGTLLIAVDTPSLSAVVEFVNALLPYSDLSIAPVSLERVIEHLFLEKGDVRCTQR